MLTELEFDLSEMQQMRDDAADVANGGTPNPFIKTVTDVKGNIAVIIGAIFKKLNFLVTEAAMNSIYQAAFAFEDNLSHNDKVTYYNLYKSIADQMGRNGYTKVRLKGYFNQGEVDDNGKKVTYYHISGFPSASGFYKNGIWMIAE